MHLGRERSSQPDEVGYSAADKLVKVIAENVCVDSEMQNQVRKMHECKNAKKKKNAKPGAKNAKMQQKKKMQNQVRKMQKNAKMQF